MSTSSKDPNVPDANAQPDPARPENDETLAGKALPYIAALAAAAAVSQPAQAVPVPDERDYLEALLQGSWTQPPDLTERRLPAEADPAELAGGLASAADPGFNDSFNPNPKPYSDKTYADSGFGDRTN